METEEIRIVQAFNNAINDGNVEQLSSLMTEDHTFIDASGTAHSGVKEMTEGWKEFFHMFPDYKIEAVDITQNDSTIGVFGYASGSYKGIKNNYFRIPASWKAIVKEGKIKHWQVYCEMKEIEKIVEGNN